MTTKTPKRPKFSERMASPIAGLKYGSIYAFGFGIFTMAIYSNMSFGSNAGCLSTIFFFTLNPLFMLWSAPWSLLFNEGLGMKLQYSVGMGGAINILIISVAIGIFKKWRQSRRSKE